MNDFLVFRKMITLMIIQIIFWVGVAVCVIGGLVGIFLGIGQRYGSLMESRNSPVYSNFLLSDLTIFLL